MGSRRGCGMCVLGWGGGVEEVRGWKGEGRGVRGGGRVVVGGIRWVGKGGEGRNLGDWEGCTCMGGCLRFICLVWQDRGRMGAWGWW